MVGDLDSRYDKRGVGGLIMVGGLVPQYDSGGQEGVHFRQRQGGEVFSRIGGGTLHDKATL